MPVFLVLACLAFGHAAGAEAIDGKVAGDAVAHGLAPVISLISLGCGRVIAAQALRCSTALDSC